MGGGASPKDGKHERTGTNGGQRTNTHQFIFVKKLDEGGGNECVKSLQERVDLRLDGPCHPQLCHQLDVFSLRHTHTHTAVKILTKVFFYPTNKSVLTTLL